MTGGETGAGLRTTGGSTSGDGIYAYAQGGNDAGMHLVAHGTGEDLEADITTSVSSASIASAVWGAAKSGYTGATTFGDLATDLDTVVGYGAPPAASVVADAVWDEAKSGHTGANTFGDLATDVDTIAVDVAGLDGAAMRGTDSAALASELAKVPKSDGSASWNATALAAINAEVDGALNTAIPTSPTADSVNERVKALDDLKPASTIAAASDVPSAATVADAVWDEASSGHIDTGKAGAQLWTDIDAILADTGTDGVVLSSATMNSIAAALHDLANGIETGYTLRQVMRIVAAALAGKLSGAATTTNTIRSITDAKNRIVATVTADGDRTAITLDGTT
jgi:hypothetical protein